MSIPLTTSLVISEIAAERARQDAKWGVQNHPLVDALLHEQNCSHKRMAEEYEIPTALRATQLCQWAAQKGQVTWLHILQEEVSEFMAESQHSTPYPDAARAELVQIAAVAVAAIEAFDRARAEVVDGTGEAP